MQFINLNNKGILYDHYRKWRSILYNIIQHNSYFKNSPGISSQNRKSRKRNKIKNIWKEDIKLSVFADDNITYIGNSKKSSSTVN